MCSSIACCAAVLTLMCFGAQPLIRSRVPSGLGITKRERYTLLAVRRMFDVLKGTSFAQDIESVLRKLEQRMTAEERAEHATFGERFAYLPDGGTKKYTDKDDVIDALLSGVLSRKLVRYAYRGARRRSQRGVLAPFAMLVHKHRLYVLGKNVASTSDTTQIETGDVVNWAVERFTDAGWLRHTSFMPPATFKLDDYVDDVIRRAPRSPSSRPVDPSGRVGATSPRSTMCEIEPVGLVSSLLLCHAAEAAHTQWQNHEEDRSRDNEAVTPAIIGQDQAECDRDEDR